MENFISSTGIKNECCTNFYMKNNSELKNYDVLIFIDLFREN